MKMEILNDQERSVDTEQDSETRCQSCLRVTLKCAKNFVAFLFSHVGLTCLVAGYAILGGIAFKAVELPQEKQIRQDIVDTKDTFVQKITDLFADSDLQRVLDKKATSEQVNDLLKEYQDKVYVFSKERDWDGRFEGDDFQWSFAESLLYSVTVISTIGYGNITPKTTGGRLLTIVYGVAGIPLTMLCLHNIGNLMAGCFRLLYRYACINMTYEYIKLKRRRLKQRFMKRLHGKTRVLREWARKQQSHVTSILHHSHMEINEIEETPENKDGGEEEMQIVMSVSSERDSSLISHETGAESRSNRRRHSENPKTGVKIKSERRKHSISLHNQSTPVPTNLTLVRDMTVIPEDEIAEITTVDTDIKEHRMSREIPVDNDKASATTSLLSLTDFDEGERILKAKLKDTRDLVPISVCLLLVTGYIILGALIFTSWEENWNFLIAFYFCFITLTTIGFGDFVPGMGRLDNDEKRVFGAMYLLLGMALIAMSFHLIQEEVRHKCRKLAVRIGLIEQKLTKMLDNYEETHIIHGGKPLKV